MLPVCYRRLAVRHLTSDPIPLGHEISTLQALISQARIMHALAPGLTTGILQVELFNGFIQTFINTI